MKPTNVDEYINQFASPVQDRLRQMREVVLSVIPKAEERISYGMPAYFLNGKVVVYFSGFEQHIGLYPGKVAKGDLKELVGPYLYGASTARFYHDKPLPVDIIKQIVSFRCNEVAQKG